MVTEVPVAQSPAVGVKLYVPEVVLLTVAGLQVPLMPLFDVVGKVGAVAPEQISVRIVKDGRTLGCTVMVTEAPVAQRPAVGVKL